MVVGEFTREAGLVVIGGGPGGYSAAFRAAELGIDTVLVDSREHLGGMCLHEGCIPSKTLLHIAHVMHNAERAAEFGIHYGKPKIDMQAVQEWVDQAVAKLASGLKQVCAKHGVEHVHGEAQFEDSRRLAVRNGPVPRIRFKRAIIATGSSPKPHAALSFDNERVLTPQQALKIEPLPKSLLVLGGNYNALELACIYAAFGSEVTLVHHGERLLPDVDADLVRPLARELDKRLAQICLQTDVKDVSVAKDGLRITFTGEAQPKETRFDRVIVAIGHQPNINGLNLDKTAVSLGENGFIVTDDQQHTSDQRILAAGDVTGGVLLADRAMMQGRVAAEVVAGWNSYIDVRAVPVAVFTDPQIAWCGLSEQDTKAQNIPYEVTRQPWGASGRAVGMGRTEGASKIIYDPDTQLILGMGIVGPHAAELISEAALAIEMGAVITDLATTVHPHPTLSEMFSDAARRVENRDSGVSGS